MKTRIAEYKWRKTDKHTLKIEVYVCECGTDMTYIGFAGCAHDSDYTYFYQCRSCKTVGLSGYKHDRKEEVEKAGYKLIT